MINNSYSPDGPLALGFPKKHGLILGSCVTIQPSHQGVQKVKSSEVDDTTQTAQDQKLRN